MKPIKFCPICGSSDVVEFSTRPAARCNNCGGLERTRLLYLLMNRMGILSPRTSILHLAPEPGLFRKLSRLTPHYQAADYDVSQYKVWSPEVKFVDLCDVPGTVEGTYDLIIHNHVLEHVPCSVSGVLAELRARLNPGGIMLFSVPIRTNFRTEEDLDPSLTHAERKARFGQWDHMRMFGDLDFFEACAGDQRNPVQRIDPLDYVSQIELNEAFIPDAVHKVSGHSIYALKAK